MVSAVVLAGGRSQRMGRDKAWLESDGQALITRAVSTVRAAGIKEVFISGRAGTDYSAIGCPVLLDREPGHGPLGGVERALETSSAPLVLVLAVDLPRMAPCFLRQLAAQCDLLTGVVPSLRGSLEPLAAIYPRRCSATVRECLLKAHLSARHFADACLAEQAVRLLEVSENDAGCFENWNSPSDAA